MIINKVTEYGFDGLALDYNGVYHALQAKNYETNKVTANCVGTFTSALLNRLCVKNSLSKGFLYTTSPLEINLSEDLENGNIINHEQLSFSVQKKHDKTTLNNESNYELRTYQTNALDIILKNKGLQTVELFCSGGKTVIAGHYLAKKLPQIVVVIAPLRLSVDNLFERIPNFLKGYKILLYDCDNNNKTEQKLKEQLDKDEKVIIFSTYKSSEHVLNNVFTKKHYKNAEIIVDEVHNTLNKNVVCEFINKFKNGLLLSATIPDEIYEQITCTLGYKYSFSQAIQNNFVTDYKIWLPTGINIDDAIVKESADLTTKAKYLITGMLISGSRRCIVYCSSKEECAKFNKEFENLCNTYYGIFSWTEKIISNTSYKERNRIIREFQSPKDNIVLHIISSVRILDEAVNIVKCDSEFIMNVGKKEDDIRFVQRLYRGGRIDCENQNKVNNCFIWTDDLCKSLNIFDLLKENDCDFRKKIRTLNPDYDNYLLNKENSKNNDYSKELIKYLTVRCKSLDEIRQEKAYLLLKIINEEQKITPHSFIYEGYKIGQFWSSIKQGQNKDIYKEILCKNEILKKDYEKCQQNKEKKTNKPKLLAETKANLLIEFYNIHGNITRSEKSKNYKGFDAGDFWRNIKRGDNKHVYDTILSKHEYFRTEFENFLIKEKNKLSKQDKANLLIKFVSLYKKTPTSNKIYEECRIGDFLARVKQGFHKKIYNDILSKNKIIKMEYEKFKNK